MYRDLEDRRQQMAMASIDDLVPSDHLLRRVDAVLDLSWVAERLAPLYSAQRGAPVIAPERVLRLLLAGYLLGTPGLRPLLRRAETCLAMRWFARYGLTDRLPDHSSLSKILRRWGPELFAELFERSVAQCLAAGLVGGKAVHYDATLLRADVSTSSLTRRWVEVVSDEAAADDDPPDDPPDGDAPPTVRFAKRGETMARQSKKRSRTDPDCTLATGLKSRPLVPSYKAHVTVDGRAAVVVDVHLTTGERSEQHELTRSLDRLEARLGGRPRQVTADKGCASGGNYARLEELGQEPVIPPQREPSGRRRADGTVCGVSKRRFRVDARHERVTCPRGAVLRPQRRAPEGTWYVACAADCAACGLRSQCLSEKAPRRRLLVGDHDAALTRARRATERGWPADWQALYREHRAQVEGWHGEAKQRHGLGRAVFRGLAKVSVQVYLTAVVMNLKKLAGPASRATLRPLGGRQLRRRRAGLVGGWRFVAVAGAEAA